VGSDPSPPIKQESVLRRDYIPFTTPSQNPKALTPPKATSFYSDMVGMLKLMTWLPLKAPKKTSK